MLKYDALVKEKGLSTFNQTTDLDFSDCDLVLDKMDGSLISSYLHNGEVFMKSKTSLHSDQARAALDLINTEKYERFKAFIECLEHSGMTVNLEYTAPENRIVLPYQKAALTILNIRCREPQAGLSYGEYIDHEAVLRMAEAWDCEQFVVKNHAEKYNDYPKFINTINNMQDIEGFVIRIRNGETVKIKTEWYCALHHAKDSINSPRRLFEVVANEAHDDLRGIFPEDEYLMKRIADMEKVVQGIYAKIKINVEQFFHDNAGLDRKSYAILGSQTLPRLYFSLAMNLYLGKENDYKEWMIKHYKDFGITDDPTED